MKLLSTLLSSPSSLAIPPQLHPALALLRCFSSNGGGPQLLRLHNCSCASIQQCTTISTAPEPHFLVDFLVNSLEFSTEEAVSATSKVSRSRPTKQPLLVLEFLQKSGLTTTQIKKIVAAAPNLLLSDVDKTLEPKIRVLQELGLSGTDLYKVIKGNYYFALAIDSQIKPSLDYLRMLMGDDETVVKAIKKSPWLLSCNAPKTLESNRVFLRKIGFSDEKVVKFLFRNPASLMRKPQWLQGIVDRVEKDFGIPRDSGMFFYALAMASSVKESKLQEKFVMLRSYGWSDEDIKIMFRKLPHCFGLSDSKLRRGIEFFMNELGLTPAYLATHPTLLVRSLETSIIPRIEVLRILNEKDLNPRKRNLYTALCLPEPKFYADYVLPYKDAISDLYTQYTRSVGK